MAIDWTGPPHFILKGGYEKGKKEKQFEAEIFRNLRKLGYIAYHPSDVGLSYKFLDGHIISPEGELGWIEFKKIEGSTFNVSQFEESQVILLKELYRRNPDIARVFIYSVVHNDYKVFTFTELWDMKNPKGGIKIF